MEGMEITEGKRDLRHIVLFRVRLKGNFFLGCGGFSSPPFPFKVIARYMKNLETHEKIYCITSFQLTNICKMIMIRMLE